MIFFVRYWIVIMTRAPSSNVQLRYRPSDGCSTSAAQLLW